MDARKFEESIASRNLTGLQQALREFHEGNASDRDERLIFDDTVLSRIEQIAEGKRYGGNEARWEGVIAHDHEAIREGEQLLAEGLEWEVALAEVAALKFDASSRIDRSRLPPAFEMVGIQAGTFIMGSPPGEVGHEENESQVDVQISQSFQLGRTVVTQRQWMDVMTTTPWTHETELVVDEGGELVGVEFFADVATGDDFPAVFMSWHHTTAFCRVLTSIERRRGRLSEAQEYRLPTEAEWEYACRAGSKSAYCFGGEVEMLAEYAWCAKSTRHTDCRSNAQVAQKRPNRWGLYDMHGNIYEWCADWYLDELPGGRDPLAIGMLFSQAQLFGEYPLIEPRVVRGGNWMDESAKCRSSARWCWDPWVQDHFNETLGFRVVLGSCREGLSR